jgi:hypothetical protein
LYLVPVSASEYRAQEALITGSDLIDEKPSTAMIAWLVEPDAGITEFSNISRMIMILVCGARFFLFAPIQLSRLCT